MSLWVVQEMGKKNRPVVGISPWGLEGMEKEHSRLSLGFPGPPRSNNFSETVHNKLPLGCVSGFWSQ